MAGGSGLGVAEEYFENLSDREKDTYEHACAALFGRYPKVQQNSSFAIEKLQFRVQGARENIHDFANSIEALVLKAYPEPEYSRELRQKHMKCSFMAGLRPGFEFVTPSEDESFAALVARVYSIEERSAYRKHRAARHSSAASRSLYDSESEDHDEVKPIREELSEIRQLLLNSRISTERSERTRQPERNHGNRQQYLDRTRATDGRVICFYCRKPGHRIQVCKKRLYDESHSGNSQ